MYGIFHGKSCQSEAAIEFGTEPGRANPTWHDAASLTDLRHELRALIGWLRHRARFLAWSHRRTGARRISRFESWPFCLLYSARYGCLLPDVIMCRGGAKGSGSSLSAAQVGEVP